MATQSHLGDMRVSCLLQLIGLGSPAQNCVMRPLALSLQTSNRTVQYEGYQTRRQLGGTQELSLVRRVPSLRNLDTERVFCSAGGCTGFIEDQLLYIDNNHLRVAGSRRVAPLNLKAALEWVRHAK